MRLLARKVIQNHIYSKSKDQILKDVDYITYYQGLSWLKLGNKEKAAECFKALIAEGEKKMKQDSDIDFFAKFGEREADNVRLSNAYLPQRSWL